MEHWFSRLDKSTWHSYYTWLYRFLFHAHKSPNEAVAWAKNVNQYEVLDQIQGFVNTIQGAYATKQHAYVAVRSFFLHNRVMLAKDPSFRIRADKPPTERRLDPVVLRELIGFAPLWLRSMILVKWMSISDTQGTVYIGQHYAGPIVEAIENNTNPVKLRMLGRKRSRNIRPFYTFTGKDSLDSLKEYFERVRGYPKPNEPIWVYEAGPGDLRGKPVTTTGFLSAWTRLCLRAKLRPKPSGNRGARYGYNIHNTRDIAISLLNTVEGLNPLCPDFWAGHEIDDLGYNKFYELKPDYVEDQYRLAEPYLNIISNQTSVDPHEAEWKQKMEHELAELRKLLGTQSG